MAWFKVIVPAGDMDRGLNVQIQNKFDALFVAAGGPEGAALFSNGLSQDGLELYFTPEASHFAFRLIAEYGGIPCEKPVGSLSLMVGNQQTN